MKKNDTKKITSIGGSALIEGIMMRGPKKTTVAVRTGEDSIYTEDIEMKFLSQSAKIWKIPFFRGISGMIDSMRLSYKALMLSADKALEAGVVEEEEPSKFEKWVDEKLGDKFMKILMVFASVLGVALAIALFFVLPRFLWWLFTLIFPALAVPAGKGISLTPEQLNIQFWQSVFQGVMKIVIFIAYILVVSQMSDMKRVFMYHGAEHKTIFCYENELPLTVENVKKQTRFHPRCGTSFILLSLLVGIVVGFFIPVSPFGVAWLQPVFKLLLLPLTIGIGYELIKFCGRHDNKLTRIIAAPGLWAQRITTKEPDESMCEVAIKAMTAVIPDDGSDIVKDGCGC